MPSITIDKEKTIKKFLKPISSVSDVASIIIKSNEMECSTYSVDKTKQTIVSYIKFTDFKQKDIVDIIKLNLSSVNRLIQFLSVIPENEITLELTETYIHYNSKGLNFKYYLINSSALPKEIMNTETILSFPYEMEFNIKKDKVKEVIRLSAIVSSKLSDSDSSKIYFFTRDGEVYGELNDKTIPNLDSAESQLSDSFIGEQINIPLPISFSVFKLFSSIDYDFLTVKINVKRGIITFNIKDIDGEQIYLTSARVK